MKIPFEHTFAEALEDLYVPFTPPGFPAPEMVQWNAALAEDLGLGDWAPEEAARVLSGTVIAPEARPLAQAYAGHQFGGFSPQLGDGRALLLGELIDRRGNRVDVHLKGSGRTPFSRGGDGKATLGPVLREALMGEAMYALGIPTTRVLAAIRTGEAVLRDRWLPGAVLARVAASHLRVGTLEFFSARNEHERLVRLVRYALERHYPDRVDSENQALELLRSVALAQGQLIAQWMLVGFIHGVMNTDNVTLSGETIDYGPCAFMDAYDPATVFSSIDHRGRYAYGNQPAIGQWNLARMGEALLPLISPDEERAVAAVREALGLYQDAFETAYRVGMRQKLGLVGASEDDESLISGLFAWMKSSGRDFTTTFRRLAEGLVQGAPPYADRDFQVWHARWRERLGDDAVEVVAARMNAVNPIYVPRNHLVEEALEAAVGDDLGPFRELLAVLASPFELQPGRDRYTEPAPDTFGPYQTFCGT